MLYIQNQIVPKVIQFPDPNSVFIESHREKDGVYYFTYVLILSVNKRLASNFDENLLVRGFYSQKKAPAISLKKSEIFGSNVFRKIDKQRSEQVSSRKYQKKYFFTYNIGNNDLKEEIVVVKFEVSTDKVNSKFTIETAKSDLVGRQIEFIDSIDINHDRAVQIYDLPKTRFSLTTTRDERRRIFASVTSDDIKTSGFRFYLRKNSSFNFIQNRFDQEIASPLGPGGISNAVFVTDDTDQEYTIRATPISKILNQNLGNFREVSSGFTRKLKKVPFYIQTISDSTVSFSLGRIDNSVRRIALYRRRIDEIQKTFVDGAITRQRQSVTDARRQPQYDYVYTLEFQDDRGITLDSSSEIVVPALKLDTLASVSAKRHTQQEAILGKKSISFDVSVSYGESSLYDKIVEDFKSIGLESLVEDDLQKMTNNLKPLIRIIATRISQITGEEQDLGVFQPGIINITDSTKDPSIYRFEVAVRSGPESLEMLSSGQNVLSQNAYNLKSIPDLSSKSIGNRSKTGSDSFSSKFFTKSSIRQSTLRYGDASSLADLGYYSGRTGIFADVIVRPQTISGIVIKNLTYSQTPEGGFISWNVQGNQQNVDEYEILLDNEIFLSQPSDKTVQIFSTGERVPSTITVTPVVLGIKSESGNASIKVNSGN